MREKERRKREREKRREREKKKERRDLVWWISREEEHFRQKEQQC